MIYFTLLVDVFAWETILTMCRENWWFSGQSTKIEYQGGIRVKEKVLVRIVLMKNFQALAFISSFTHGLFII